jgi:hypothetical protein
VPSGFVALPLPDLSHHELVSVIPAVVVGVGGLVLLFVNIPLGKLGDPLIRHCYILRRIRAVTGDRLRRELHSPSSGLPVGDLRLCLLLGVI